MQGTQDKFVEFQGDAKELMSRTEKAVKLMAQGPWNVELLNELATLMRDASICGLGQTAASAIESAFANVPALKGRAS